MQVSSTQAPVRINTKRRQAHAGSRRHHELHAHLRRRNVLYFRTEEQHIPQLWSIVHAPQRPCARIARSIQRSCNRAGCRLRRLRTCTSSILRVVHRLWQPRVRANYITAVHVGHGRAHAVYAVHSEHPRFHHAVRYHWLLRRCRRG